MVNKKFTMQYKIGFFLSQKGPAEFFTDYKLNFTNEL